MSLSGVLVVNEIFGPTIQGEGPSSGRPCAFLRLGGCNLSCRWCDTPYTWDWTGKSDEGRAYSARDELHPMTSAAVADRLLRFPVDLIVISGGEPLSQQRNLIPLVELLRVSGKDVEIETNGTIEPSAELIRTGTRFNVSPKLAHSGDRHEKRIKPLALKKYAASGQAIFKFVCRGEQDLDEVGALADAHKLSPVWIMPEGRTAQEIVSRLATLAGGVVERGWHITGRLHVLIWGDRRGV